MASTEHANVPFARPGAVIDVGASRGQFSLLARSLFPGVPIVAFEPLPVAARIYRSVVGDSAQLFPYAVGAGSGTKVLQISAADDSSSLLTIGTAQTSIFPGTERAGELDVEVVSLAEAVPVELPGPWLLKIDVQGFELEVLRGAQPVLSNIGEIYVECSFTELYGGQPLADEVISFLLEQGFRLRGAFNVTTAAGVPVQADLLFRKG